MAWSPNPSPGRTSELVSEVKAPRPPRPAGPPKKGGVALWWKIWGWLSGCWGSLCLAIALCYYTHLESAGRRWGTQGERRDHLWHKKPLISLFWGPKITVSHCPLLNSGFPSTSCIAYELFLRNKVNKAGRIGQAAPQPSPSATWGLGALWISKCFYSIPCCINISGRTMSQTLKYLLKSKDDPFPKSWVA